MRLARDGTGRDLGMLVAGLDQPVADAAMLGALPDREHPLERSLHAIVDEDAAAGARGRR